MPGDLPHASSGIAGLDEILRGGYQRERLYLVSGDPGTGKTTLALQYVLDGARLGESSLYVTLSETEPELNDVARSHGWKSLDKVQICELQPPREILDPERQYSFYHPSEVELGDTMDRVLRIIDEVGAKRVVFDSLSELRLLAGDSLRYRRQVLALKQLLAARSCTTLLLDASPSKDELAIDTIAHGVLHLEQLAPEYGPERRRLRLTKVRAEDFRDGFHDYAIRSGGLEVFPRLVASDRDEVEAGPAPLSSGLDAFDAMVGGSLERGTSTLILGPAGVGKSTLSTQYVAAAAARGEASVVFLFDERRSGWIARAEGLGMRVAAAIETGLIVVEHVTPAALSPGELADRVRRSVDDRRVRLVVIDSLNGYEMSMPGERYLPLHLHEMLEYLNRRGVNALMPLEQHGLVGDVRASSSVTYIADNVVLLRYFEALGEVRRAISVIKKRLGAHERSIRECSIVAGIGIVVGEPIRSFTGVLTGTPVYLGGAPAASDGELRRSQPPGAA